MTIETFTFDKPPESQKRLLLTLELIPSTAWGSNLREILPRSEWDKLRKGRYKIAEFCCEICGKYGFDQGFSWPVECHEVWDFDEDKGIQKLVRLIALCPLCHQVKHFGRTELMGDADRAVMHLMHVNRWSRQDALKHIKEAAEAWERRSAMKWTLDVTHLQELGVPLPNDGLFWPGPG